MCFRLSIHYILYAVCWCISITAETDRHFAGVNIAYGKPATQGPDAFNYISSRTMINYTADLAVDGGTSGNFLDNSCTLTTGTSSTNAYWTVDLQKAYKITGIIIYNRDDDRIRLKNFIIYGNGTEVIHNSLGSTEYDQRKILIPLEEGRSFSSITVQLPANDGHSVNGLYTLTLCEVKIFAVKMQPHTETNKAGLIGGTVSAAGLIISASLVALLIICRRRKRNLKDQEESLKYTSLRKSQIGPSSSNYAELNVTGLEDGISSKGEMPSGSEHAVYYNTTTEL